MVNREVPPGFDEDLERNYPLPGVDGIDQWGERAREEFGLDDGSSSLRYEKRPNGPGILDWRRGEDRVRAFHDDEAIVADATDLSELEVYQDDERLRSGDQERANYGEHTEFEFRLYSGRTVVEGESEPVPSGSSIRVTLGDGVPSKPRGIVVRILRHVGSWMTGDIFEPTDPFMWRRLQHFERRLPTIAHNYPDIGGVASQNGHIRAFRASGQEPVVIFVHGTFSCAVPTLSLLSPLKAKTFRFEHDTFAKITQNSEQLVEAIDEYAQRATRLFLVGHSRGGLVARHAAIELAKQKRHAEVLTFGTPHVGTPMANAGIRAFNLVLSSGRALVDGVPTWDALSLAGKTLLKSKMAIAPPPGIASMIPKSELLKTLDEPPSLHSWGGTYDASKSTAATLRYSSAFADGAFKGTEHDLVVGLESSIGRGKGTRVPDCNHFEYFGRPEIMNKIRALGS